MTIEFGEWRLRPFSDGRNWELERRNARGGWKGTGRYYQWNTLTNAFRYAADRELAEGGGTVAEGVWAAAQEFQAVTERFVNALGRQLTALRAESEGGNGKKPIGGVAGAEKRR